MNDPSPQARPLSAILDEVAHHPSLRISVAELSERFGGRALGAMIFVFAVACFLPLPPGATTIFGAPLLLLAPQLIIGADAPWLPARLRERTILVADLRRSLPGFIKWLRRIEAISRPRLSFMFGPMGDRLVGLICTLLACVLILPIPLGNMLPAAAVTVLSLSLVQRDGLLALLGYALAVTSVSVLVVAFQVIAGAARHAIMLLTAS